MPLEHSAFSVPALVAFQHHEPSGCQLQLPSAPVRAPCSATNPSAGRCSPHQSDCPSCPLRGPLPAAPPRQQTPTAGQALRALLQLPDDSVLPALAALAPQVDLARLRDLVSQTVFSSLVRALLTARKISSGSTSSMTWRRASTGGRTWTHPCPPVAAARAFGPPKRGGLSARSFPRQQTITRPVPRDVCPLPGLRLGRHLPVRGYCAHICPCVRPSHNCYGLCLRPIHIGERTGHGDYKCFNCLRARKSLQNLIAFEPSVSCGQFRFRPFSRKCCSRLASATTSSVAFCPPDISHAPAMGSAWF